MEKKGQTIFLSVVGIATLLVAIVGATFAWFSTTVTGNDTAKDITVTTATLGTITFEDGAVINLPAILPGATTTKNFTITAAANSTVVAKYDIAFDITTNTLSPVVNATAEKEFVYSLSGTSTTGTGTNAGTVATAVTAAAVPDASAVIGSGTIGTLGSAHTYTLTLTFKSTGKDQNAAKGKTFAGKIKVTATTTYTDANK